MSLQTWAAMAQMSLSATNQFAEKPKQAAKRRKKERERTERIAEILRRETELAALEATGPVVRDPSWGRPLDPEPAAPAPEWNADGFNDEFRKTPEQLKKERIDENLKYWPYRQTVPRWLVTLAPYLLNNLRDTIKPGQPFALPEVKQSCGLFEKLLNNDVVRQNIVDRLFEHHDEASKFAATSRQSWKYLIYDVAIWDFTRGWFGNCEIPREQLFVGDQISASSQGSVSSVVIITPVRGPKVYPEDIEELDEVPETVDTHLYEHHMRSMHRMCLSMSNFADFFQNLQLHRLPFLTTQILELVIPSMRNLKVLGVYKCQLIHIGDTMKLLEIIQTDRPKGRDTQISLDFYPNFHVGPIPYPGHNRVVGAYGPLWDNWNGDTRLGVWQLISVILPQAQKQKQDFWSKHTMFRQWLDRTPCWRVTDTLATLVRGNDDDRTDEEIDEDFVVMCDAPNTGGKKEKFKSKIRNRPEGYDWMLERHPCRLCKLNVLGIFHYYDDIRQSLNMGLTAAQLSLTCLGCRLTNVLNSERDHYKLYKRSIIASWLRMSVDPETDEETWNTNDLAKALKDFGDKNIVDRAKALDVRRVNQMLRPAGGPENALDRENDEVQKPLTHAEKGRLGMKNRSPTLDTKDLVMGEWNYYDITRRWDHGHGIPH